MHIVEFNIFAARIVHTTLTTTSKEGQPLKNHRILRRLVKQLERKVEEFEHYQLTKSDAIVEAGQRELLKKRYSAKTEKDDKLIVESYLLNLTQFTFHNNKKAAWAFDDLPTFQVKGHHWEDDKHPIITLELENNEYDLLREIFSEESPFGEAGIFIVCLIDDGLEAGKEELTIEQVKAWKKKKKGTPEEPVK